MLIVIAVFLGIILLEFLAVIWLLFRILPVEEQKAILRKVEPINTKVLKWTPPQSEEEAVFEKVIKSLKE